MSWASESNHVFIIYSGLQPSKELLASKKSSFFIQGTASSNGRTITEAFTANQDYSGKITVLNSEVAS